MEQIDNKKKIKICEMLGARQFQTVVFEVERIKFKLIKKLFPNFLKHFEKRLDKQKAKELEKVHSEYTRREIISKYQELKTQLRREMNFEQNRNYHMNKHNPTKFIHYLEWNKAIHKKGLIKDAIALPALILATFLGAGTATIPLIAIELFSAFINFECVNIQNYNIYRFKEKEETLKKLEKRKNESEIKKYGEALGVIEKTMKQSEDIPTIDELLKNINSIEQLNQMKAFIEQAQKEHQMLKSDQKEQSKKGVRK